MEITWFSLIIAYAVVYLGIWMIVERICKCIEHCATAKAFSSLSSRNSKSADLLLKIMKDMTEKPEENGE